MPFPIGASPFQSGTVLFDEGSGAVIAVADARSKVRTSISLWSGVRTTHLIRIEHKPFQYFGRAAVEPAGLRGGCEQSHAKLSPFPG